MKNSRSIIWFIIGSIPYIITFIYSILSIFIGVSSCLLSKKYGICEPMYGFRAFGQVWYILLYTFYPVYLVFLLFMILGYSNKKMNAVTRNRMFLLFGAAPFVLSLLLFLFACLASPNINLASLFSSIFIHHFFIVVSDIFGIVCILFSLYRLRTIKK